MPLLLAMLLWAVGSIEIPSLLLASDPDLDRDAMEGGAPARSHVRSHRPVIPAGRPVLYSPPPRATETKRPHGPRIHSPAHLPPRGGPADRLSVRPAGNRGD